MPSRRACLACLALLVSAVSAEARGPVDGAVRLVPHRAVYDLSLVSSSGMRGVESARGRIAFDLTGNACDGYGLKFRQVTVIQTQEGEPKTSDLRSAQQESGDGRSFRFRTDNVTAGAPKLVIDGAAERRPGGPLSVRLKTPKRQTVSLDPQAVFPNAQMRDLIAAARDGRRTVAMKLFDGSDDGRKIYETLAVIGSRIEPSAGEGLEEAARQDPLTKLPRWPVTLSYFTPGRGDLTPAYVLGFELYDNGVSRALRLDYGDFVLKGEMTRLDLLPTAAACQR